MTQLNLSQLNLLVQNNMDSHLFRFIDKEHFLMFALENLVELFQHEGKVFTLLEPLLASDIEVDQHTVLAVDQIEIGDLFLISNSFHEEASLVYYSPSGFLETVILDYEEYENILLSDYLVLLHEFFSLLHGSFLLYQKS